MSDTVSGRTEGMGDDALVAATGKAWSAWFELLDTAGAVQWKHSEIARWLHDEHLVPHWWCQSVAVGFEQARGLRLPGQRADGTFEVSASKTLPLEQQPALDALIRTVTTGLGRAPASESREVTFITARWKLDGRQSLLATANPAKDGRTSVSLTHQRLSDAAQVTPAKAAMQAWLTAAASGGPHLLG